MVTIPTTTQPGSVFDGEGTDVLVGGNTPFLLDGNDNVWIVRSGRVEIFAVTVEEGQPRGTRHHFLTADPGEALFGMDLERYGQGMGFLAVGVVGTRLSRLPLATFQQQAIRSPEFVVPLVDKWVRGLSLGVSKTIIPKPRADLTLLAGDQGELGDGQRARAKSGIVWARHLEGSTLFIGMEEVGSGASALVPLTPDTFLQALGATRIEAVDTRSALSTLAGWAGLDAFYDVLFRCEFFNTRLAAADELNRLKEKAERDRRTTARALDGLAGVLREGGALVVDLDSDDLLLRASAIVAKKLGLTVKAPPRPREGEAHADPLGEIARASKIRMRKVLLKGDWSKEETTPLLAWLEIPKEGKRPVAVLPLGPGRYQIFDPAAPEPRPLTSDDLATMAPVAYTFYRSFPEGALTAVQVFKFGLKDNLGDLRRPLLVGLISGLLGLLVPHITGRIVDKVIPEASRDRLAQMALILATVGITTTLLDVVRRLGVLRLEIKMSADVQPAMWDRLIGLPAAFFRKYTSGDLSVRVSSIDRIRQVLSAATTTSLMLGLFSVLYVVQLFYYSWKLALLGLGLVILPLTATAIAAHLKLNVQREVADVEGRISGLVLQLLSGVSKLRVTGAEGRAFAEWARDFSKQKRLALRTGVIDATVNVFNAAFPVLASMGLFKLMLYLTQQAIKDGEKPLSIGDFVAFNAAFIILLTNILQLGTAVMSALTAIPLFDRARPILETKVEVDSTKADPGELNGDIEVSHVSFRYQPDGPLILDDVSIEIPAGKFVAIVGPSGSGKSTLLKLMLGLDPPETGAIYYDGRDLSLMDAQRLRRRMGIVIQNGKIRSGTIFENIIGSQPLALDDAWEAAHMAGLGEDIENMAMGMHTVLQQGGGALSGGQRQRLMIARAIVAKPRILVFDEATSALDNRTQSIVSESLQSLQATRIAIAHRLSTIIGADMIYVMVNGRVVESGNYQELSAKAGMFADLVRRQVA